MNGANITITKKIETSHNGHNENSTDEITPSSKVVRKSGIIFRFKRIFNDTVIAIIQTRTGPIKAFILSTK